VLSVLLRYTDSDCPFGIFKLFFHDSLQYVSFYCLNDCLLSFVYICIAVDNPVIERGGLGFHKPV